MVDLGSLGSGSAIANDVSELGRVVGYSFNASGQRRAFLWKNGEMRDLGVLPGESDSEATAINEAGQIVGVSGNRGFLWEDGVMSEIPGFSTVWNRPIDINNDERVVGWSINSSGDYVSFGWDVGVSFSWELPSKPSTVDDYWVTGVNELGQMGVHGDDNANSQTPVRGWRALTGSYVDIVDPWNNGMWSVDINNSGYVLCNTRIADDSSRGFYWRGGSYQLVAPLPAYGHAHTTVTGVNDLHEVVGYSYNSTSDERAIVWSAGTPVDLTTRIANLPNNHRMTRAYEIENSGKIIGWMKDLNSGSSYGVMLTPIPDEGLILLPDATREKVVVVDPVDRVLLDYVAAGSGDMMRPIEIIDGHNGDLLMSDRLADHIFVLNEEARILGTFTRDPINDVRGIARSKNGYIVATSGLGFHAWDANRNEVPTPLAGNMWDVSLFDGPAQDFYLLSNLSTDNIQGYDLGLNFLGETPGGASDVPTQVALISGGRVAVASNGGSRIDIHSLRTGAIVGGFPVAGLARGVIEVAPNQFLVSTQTGLYFYNSVGFLVDVLGTGSGYWYMNRCQNFYP